MESMKHFYKWYYSLSEEDKQKELDNSKLLYPFNTWDMNYHLIISDFELLIDIDDIGNELEYTDEITLGRSIVNRVAFNG